MDTLAQPAEFTETERLRMEVAGLRAETKGLRAQVDFLTIRLADLYRDLLPAAERAGVTLPPVPKPSARDKAAALGWDLPQGA